CRLPLRRRNTLAVYWTEGGGIDLIGRLTRHGSRIVTAAPGHFIHISHPASARTSFIQHECRVHAAGAQCHLAYFDHAAVLVMALVRAGLRSLIVGGPWWRVPWSPGFLTR